MEITEVSVEVGEVRNHPFEYGNRRASVRMTAALDEVDNHEVSAAELRLMARQQVEAELDGWEERIREERRIADVLLEIENEVYRVRQFGNSPDDVSAHVEGAMVVIEDLPEEMRQEWIDRVLDAKRERIAELEEIKRDEEEGYVEPEIDF
jgi:hypothetical protein